MNYTISKAGDFFTVTQKVTGGVKDISIKDILVGLKPGRYSMEIKMIRQTRSIQQNRYYWACLGLIAEEVGYILPEMTKEEKSEIIEALHEQFKERILGTKVFKSHKDKRRRIKIRSTTTTLTTEEFAKKYMDVIRRLHPYLPSPEDKNLLEFVDRYYYK